MPYVASQPLLLSKSSVKAGEEIPASEIRGWSENYLREALRAGTIVFIPPQLLAIPGAEVEPPKAPVAGGRAAKKAG